MRWVCPACGIKNDEYVRVCTCGFQAEEHESGVQNGSFGNDEPSGERGKVSTIFDAVNLKRGAAGEKSKNIKVKVQEKPVRAARDEKGDEVIVKEIESWKFSYSKTDQCIYAGTPALHPFRLKLTRQDMEELLDVLYDEAGMEKPLRDVHLTESQVLEIIGTIEAMIEDKRSGIKIKFSSDELGKLSGIISAKIKK